MKEHGTFLRQQIFYCDGQRICVDGDTGTVQVYRLFLRYFTPLLLSLVNYQWRIYFCSEDLCHYLR